MSTTNLINRRNRVKRLAYQALKDKVYFKAIQGYRLIAMIDEAIARLTSLNNLYKN